jgi:hypothetical protein
MCQITHESDERCRTLSLIFFKNYIEQDPIFCGKCDFVYEILIPFLMTIISQISDDISLELSPNDTHSSALAKKAFAALVGNLVFEKTNQIYVNFCIIMFCTLLFFK